MSPKQEYGEIGLDSVNITRIFRCDLPQITKVTDYISLPDGVWPIHSVVISEFTYSLEDLYYGGVCDTMIIDSCGNMWVMMGTDESCKVSEFVWKRTYSSYKFAICNVKELKTTLSCAQINKIKMFNQRSHTIKYIEKLSFSLL